MVLSGFGHSTFIKKCLENNIIDSKHIEAYKVNNRDFTVSTMSKATTDVQNHADPRLQSARFKEAVKYVLEWLGFESNMGNFRKFDWMLSWVELAGNLQYPEPLEKPCSNCGKFDCVMVEIPETKKRACTACWKIINKPVEPVLWKLVNGQPFYLGVEK